MLNYTKEVLMKRLLMVLITMSTLSLKAVNQQQQAIMNNLEEDVQNLELVTKTIRAEFDDLKKQS